MQYAARVVCGEVGWREREGGRVVRGKVCRGQEEKGGVGVGRRR